MSYSVTGESILARARTIASQTKTDAHQSTIIDAKGGLRVLFNNAIRQVYRNKANDQKFVRDIYVRNTVSVVSGVGACPDEVMREMLHLSQFQDDDDSLISYYNYNVDADSGQNFNQLGYVVLQGDNFHYTAPAPTLGTYTGNLFVTAPCFPVLPPSMATVIPFPSQTTVDDIVLALSAAITGNLAWDEKE